MPNDPDLDAPLSPRTKKIFIACSLGGFLFINILVAIYVARTRGLAGIKDEGIYSMSDLASHIAQCGTKNGRLPPTSRAVPPSLDEVRGKTFRSTPADWNDEAYTCTSFHLDWPQHYRLHWETNDPAREGTVHAEADLNGDGVVDQTLTMGVYCKHETTFTCSPDRSK